MRRDEIRRDDTKWDEVRQDEARHEGAPRWDEVERYNSSMAEYTDDVDSWSSSSASRGT